MRKTDIKKMYKLYGIREVELDYPDNFTFYPEFTLEKQFELLEWFGVNDKFDVVSYIYQPMSKVWFINATHSTEFSCEEPDCSIGQGRDLSEALVDLLIQVYQKLTDYEKEEIKIILEGNR